MVIELKKGRTSDVVVGQIQHYTGYLMEVIANDDQKVRGCIIALEDDKRIRQALRVTGDRIDFYCYEVSFNLKKV